MPDGDVSGDDRYKQNAPHLMAESGAWAWLSGVDGCAVTIDPVTVLPEVHYPCQRGIKRAKPQFAVCGVVAAPSQPIDFPADMINFSTG